ncbi:hypothetical protein Pmani_022847 [Petrolisthes manimaculis]|uniref:Uncharacterized protein n=1 Tax=Petrolisthes manimaculis TaxID=1843537 RepID=A0AAE1PDJ0_9EUCA|nr:hypothetical protein Pmani_022847 [Petrolisthes manimaculis]
MTKLKPPIDMETIENKMKGEQVRQRGGTHHRFEAYVPQLQCYNEESSVGQDLTPKFITDALMMQHKDGVYLYNCCKNNACAME